MSGNENQAKRRFGEYLRGLRERMEGNVSQDAAVRLIAPHVRSGSDAWKGQSTLARIEAGSVAIQPTALAALAAAYNEPLDRIVTAFAAIMIYDTALPRFFSEPSARPVKLSGQQSNFFASNAVEIWSLPEVVQWEYDFADRYPGRKDLALWIVSPSFVDHKNPSIQKVVVDRLLMRGVTLSYFIDEGDYGEKRNFGRFLDRVTYMLADHISAASTENGTVDPSNWGKIQVYKLRPSELAWFTSSLVIANPDDIRYQRRAGEGFMIVPVEGEHTLGIPLNSQNLDSFVTAIYGQVEDCQRAGDPREGDWIRDALKAHPTYKRMVLNDE